MQSNVHVIHISRPTQTYRLGNLTNVTNQSLEKLAIRVYQQTGRGRLPKSYHGSITPETFWKRRALLAECSPNARTLDETEFPLSCGTFGNGSMIRIAATSPWRLRNIY
jgi:hypothetical protein